MLELGLISAFLVGLLGGGHCVGMCGGIVGAVSLSLPGARPQFAYHLAYNAGRVASYTVAGALAGLAGASSLFLDGVLPVQKVLYLLAAHLKSGFKKLEVCHVPREQNQLADDEANRALDSRELF